MPDSSREGAKHTDTPQTAKEDAIIKTVEFQELCPAVLSQEVASFLP